MNSVTFLVGIKSCINSSIDTRLITDKVESLMRIWLSHIDLLLWHKTYTLGHEVTAKITRRELLASIPELISQLRLDSTPHASRVKNESELTLELDILNLVGQELALNLEQLLAVYVYRVQFDYIEQGNWIRVKLEIA